MCKNWENVAKLPTLRMSPRATHAGLRYGTRFQFTSSPKLWPVLWQRHGPIARGPGGVALSLPCGTSQTLLCSWVQFSGPTSRPAFGRVNASVLLKQLGGDDDVDDDLSAASRLNVVYSKRERIRYVCYMLSQIHLSSVVCLSSVTLVHPTQPVWNFRHFFHHTIAQGL